MQHWHQNRDIPIFSFTNAVLTDPLVNNNLSSILWKPSDKPKKDFRKKRIAIARLTEDWDLLDPMRIDWWEYA